MNVTTGSKKGLSMNPKKGVLKAVPFHILVRAVLLIACYMWASGLWWWAGFGVFIIVLMVNITQAGIISLGLAAEADRKAIQGPPRG